MPYDIDSIQFDIDAGEVTVVGGSTETTPFLFRGMLTGTAVGGTGSAEVPLIGSGTAWLVFGSAELDHGWFQSHYRFADAAAPIPEPGTLLLFGTGAAATVARRRKRATRARS